MQQSGISHELLARYCSGSHPWYPPLSVAQSDQSKVGPYYHLDLLAICELRFAATLRQSLAGIQAIFLCSQTHTLRIRMKQLYSHHFFIALWMLVILACPSLKMLAEETSVNPGQIILLKNRQILRGEIALYGDRYLITQPHSEIRLQRDQVEHICHDLQEAYRYLQHQIRFGEASDHLQLAQWCVDENLFREARLQLEQGMFKRPNHPRIDLIRRQLEIANAVSTSGTTEKTLNAVQSDSEELEELFDQMPSSQNKVDHCCYPRSFTPLVKAC